HPRAPLQGGLSGGEARDRDPEGRARDVVEPDPVAELDARRIASVLAADPDLQARPRLAAQLHTDLHELSDAPLVELLERVGRQDLAPHVFGQELAGVVARKAEGRLRE